MSAFSWNQPHKFTSENSLSISVELLTLASIILVKKQGDVHLKENEHEYFLNPFRVWIAIFSHNELL